VLSGGVQDVFGAASGVLLDASAVQFVEAGGIASGTVIDATDTQVVLSGGTASNTIVSSGGTVELFNSATVNGITLNSGGLVDHLSGTAVITGGTIVDSGTIDAVAPSGSLFIEPDTFTNSGAITVRNGDHVFIQPAASSPISTLAI
jgi:autotransporter passenger strand-loop-strand repeat protein